MNQKPLLVITPGDPDGIGPEITWKAIKEHNSSSADLLCVGAARPFRKMGIPYIPTDPTALKGRQTPPREKKPYVWLLPAPETADQPRALLAGFQSGWSIKTAASIVQRGLADALVTGPINKERLQQGGYIYPGHTEFLASLCRTRHVTMMLANDLLKVSLVTIHTALKNVPAQISRPLVRRTILHTASALKIDWKIRKPRICVAALNPHAGEGGLFGDEEKRVLIPEITALKDKFSSEFTLEGPLPADTLFAKHLMASRKSRWDAVVCMYHDQGLIPVKLLDFPKTVNITLGLPIIRTSVDHGVAFDLAGTGNADPSSLQAAIRLATQFVLNRK
jgi:4-hydroxythreonine-4-phosphate dehydrogenase